MRMKLVMRFSLGDWVLRLAEVGGDYFQEPARKERLTSRKQGKSKVHQVLLRTALGVVMICGGAQGETS